MIRRLVAAAALLVAFTGTAPGPYADAAPRSAPADLPPGPTKPTPDSVPLYLEGAQAKADVQIGPYTLRMMVDTGATYLSIPRSLSDRLLATGEAQSVGHQQFRLADGSILDERVISIRKVVIGNHILHDIQATASSENAVPLLGISILNMIGRFTIDTQSGQLIFG
jgi:clan AA aspartic protease (TIGR02281 family)